jgi:hypothetical protein
MSRTYNGTDRIYLAACSRDARLTRICVASIRYFYPDVPIQILPGDILQSGLAKELRKHWNVDVTDIKVGDYGWGLVKLEPLFGPPGVKFLVVDVDTVFTGPVLERRAESDADFWVDNENLPDEEFKRLYYDWDKLMAIDPETQSARKAYNAGQWFGTSGLVKREDFDRWVEWKFPRTLKHEEIFMGGDQGVMNHVVLKKEAEGKLTIDRAELMRWPGNGMDDLHVEAIKNRTAPALVVHWAGMKETFLSKTVGGDLLKFYEDFYFSKMPFGRLRKWSALLRHIWIHWTFKAFTPLRLQLVKRRKKTAAGRRMETEGIRS